MRKILVAATGVIALTAAGCATIVEGTSQKINLVVTPESAQCTGWRKGAQVGSYDSVTHMLQVTKSRNDLEIKCVATGYKPKDFRLVSGATGWSVSGALLLDAGIVDYATGALNKYDDTVTVVLERDGS